MPIYIYIYHWHIDLESKYIYQRKEEDCKMRKNNRLSIEKVI